MWHHRRFLLWHGCFSCEDKCVMWQGLSFAIQLLSKWDTTHPAVPALWDAEQHPPIAPSFSGLRSVGLIFLCKQRLWGRGMINQLCSVNPLLIKTVPDVAAVVTCVRGISHSLIGVYKRVTIWLIRQFKLGVVNIGDTGFYYHFEYVRCTIFKQAF